MSFYFRDSPKLADRLRGMSDAELLREMKQKFKSDNDEFFEPSRPSRDSFERPFSHFPRSFPFDDEDIFVHPRGDGIRAHLDNLATRHPELAEHLRGPPWPFGDSLLRDRRRRRRGSGGNDSDSQQHQVDEDARSQASGSSAASGASAVSSHSSGEPDQTSSIPQYGLRNTVDIGQQQRRRDMETSSEKDERGQRSMSAPPENRQQQGQEQQGPQPGQGQRFVSRVDITPQHNQQRSQSPSKPSSNVRHIPIFVEGRDEPVMPKFATDDTPSAAFPQRQQSPPRHFHRPSHFNEHFSRQQWPPSHFQNAFYDPNFEQPMRRNQQFQQQQPPQYHQKYQQPPSHQQQQPQYHHPQYSQQPPQQQQSQYYQQPPPQQQQQPQQQPQQQQQQQEIPKPKPAVPKDSLERVALVQKEVDDLAEQVRRYAGGSRQDKEYIYLDEMLTRELIKLDDIETEGRENVRQARKNAIKSIQDTISLLETKAPLPGQQQSASLKEKAEKSSEEKNQAEVSESMDVDTKQEEQSSSEAIPLPPSPTKIEVESSEKEKTTTTAESANQNITPAVQQNTELPNMNVEEKTNNCLAKNTEQPDTATPTDKMANSANEMSKESKPNDNEQRKDKDGDATTIENKDASAQQAEEAKIEKMETDGGQQSSTESPRLQKKKTKKTSKKEQQPVSEQAIPLPPPPPAQSAK